MKLRITSLISLCLIVMWVLSSCVEQGEYYSYKHIEKGLWYSDSVYTFQFDSLPPNAIDPSKSYTYTSEIEIVHNNTYSYGNLQIIAGYYNAYDSLMHYDTLNCILEDNSTGSWIGSGAGGLFQLTVPLVNNLTPIISDSSLTLLFSVRHSMQDNPLKGIEKIGVKIKANQP